MDVHPPHEPVHTWREAMIHVGLMTVGLFIALMLEGLVEYVHHRHIVREARETIRREIEANHQAVQKNYAELGHNSERVQANIATLYALAHEPKGVHQHRSLNFNIEWNDLNDTAWTAAHDTGALSFMPYDEAERYAQAYSMQHSLTTQFMAIFQRETESFAPVVADTDFHHISPADFDQMIHENRICFVDLFTTRQLLQQLDGQFVDILAHH